MDINEDISQGTIYCDMDATSLVSGLYLLDGLIKSEESTPDYASYISNHVTSPSTALDVCIAQFLIFSDYFLIKSMLINMLISL